MKKRIRKQVSRAAGPGDKTGLPPGTPVFVGERKQDETRIEILHYAEDHLEEIHDAGLDDCRRLKDGAGITWINVNGIHDVGLIESLGKLFGLHPLTMEDIVNTTQRPKAESYETYIFLVFKMITYNDAQNDVEIENISLILGKGYVISFQEREGDVFEVVRQRVRSARGLLRSAGSDYLAYALMDRVVDAYFVALEKIGEYIEGIDAEIILAPDTGHMHEVHRLKREILFLRKSVWPMREEIAALEKFESLLINTSTRVYLRDLYDHTIQIIELVETFRDILGGMHDTFLSSVSNRMNEVMKVLTIIATIFIPLTFIAGVYGMNFENMPELKWSWGYYLIWGIMIAIGVGMFVYFKRRRWF
ncbi:MAG: magnesium/cobalt transporter CorA [Desulfobulbaceae bacterium]|nr:magnesium/cobalt transporter CorA [Desulfobulbaceae bacterium]